MARVKGPFQLKWGENPILEVSEVTFNYDVASNDYETVQGQTFAVDGAITASVEVTLLSSDVASLRTLFPQYYVAPGDKMSTGETVSDESGSDGAIDIVAASCDTEDTMYPLDVISCNGEVFRLVNAKSSLSGIDLDNNVLRTVTVTFRGEPAYDNDGKPMGAVQMFQDGALSES